MKSKTTAGLLGILLGEFGIHWFYLGKINRGLSYSDKLKDIKALFDAGVLTQEEFDS